MSRFYPNFPVDPFIGYRNLPDPMSPGTPMVLPKQLQWPEFMTPTASLADGYGALGGSDNQPSRTINGRGGYAYKQYADGSIRIVSHGGTYLRPNSGAAWEAITKEIGPYAPPTGVGPDPIAAIINAFRSQGKEAGRATAIAAAVQYGPGVVDASQTYLQGRADDAPAIQRRLAGYKVRYAQATGKQKERIGYQIAILEQRLISLNTNPNEQAVADLPEQPGDANKNPKWLPYLTIGLGGAGLLAALYGLSK
jgi:hypothetical protein